MKKTVISLLVVCSIVACSDDFLKPDPLSFFAPEATLANKDGFESILVSLRKDLSKEFIAQKNLMAHQFMTSEIGVPWLQLDYRQLTPTTDQYQQFVGQINTIFAVVKNSNMVISRVDNQNVTWANEEERNVVLAEALWHRSYWYYRLIGCYGDLPFVGKEVTTAKLDFQTHSRWAILSKLQKDMEWAVKWLPETTSIGVPSRAAGNQLLTKIYLANLEFDKAVLSASEIIDNQKYALMKARFGEDADEPAKNVIWDLHRPLNKNLPANTETILAIVDRYEAPSGSKTDGVFTMRVYNIAFYNNQNAKDSEGNLGFVASGPLYDSLGRGNPDCSLTPYFCYKIWEEFEADYKSTFDLRRADINWYDPEELRYNNPSSVDYGKLVDPANTDYPAEFWARFYPMPFYKTYVPNYPGQQGVPYGSNGDMYIYRLAETYLLRAEAYYWKGDLGKAADDINKVRERASAIPVTAGEVTLDYIFDERARELFIEEPRQNELNRASYILAKLNRDGYTLDNIHQKNWLYDRIIAHNDFYRRNVISLGWSPYIEPFNFQWPIDDSLINANTLGRINQNKGYTGSDRNKPPLEVIEE
ncbi:MAG: RagB/SusD family nutrient uptake outer membrane protein [Tannerella sp.]|jgi:hypothetical protein|nr:RagB/SusD family nutrient uptake outer membrane protein [Tannerella sp.]